MVIYNHIVNFTFQPIPSLEINDLRVSLDKLLILYRYSLLEADLWWFYCSLSHIKQEIQHGIRRKVLVCSAADVYLLLFRLKHMLVNGKNVYLSIFECLTLNV